MIQDVSHKRSEGFLIMHLIQMKKPGKDNICSCKSVLHYTIYKKYCTERELFHHILQSTIILLNLSHIKLRVCAFYEFLEPWYEQYYRLWGWGGVVICNLMLSVFYCNFWDNIFLLRKLSICFVILRGPNWHMITWILNSLKKTQMPIINCLK